MTDYSGSDVSGAVDVGTHGASGNVFSYTVTVAGAGAGDSTPPHMTLVSPADGVVSGRVPVVIDVTDDQGPLFVCIGAFFPGFGHTELVWGGSEFEPRYAGSSRVDISGGSRYTIVRNTNWLSGGMKLKVRAFDSVGNAVVLS